MTAPDQRPTAENDVLGTCPECGAYLALGRAWPDHFRSDRFTPETCPQSRLPVGLETLLRAAYRCGYRDRSEQRDYDPGHALDLLRPIPPAERTNDA